MIILHRGMNDGWMLLWAEQSPDELRPEGNRDPVADEHPYCAGPEKMVNVLAHAAPGFQADSGETISATVWLPSRSGRRLPSSALVAEPRRSRAKPQAGAVVHACILSVSGGRHLPVPGRQGEGMLTNGVGIGVDLAYWNRAVRFGAGLVVRQRFVPGTIYDAGGMRTAWAPLFIGADAERLVRLSQRMPAAARALSDPEADEPHDQPAVTVLQTFVAVVVDSLVRNANGAPEVAAPQVRRRKTASDSMHDAWLSGLESVDGAVHGARKQLGQLRAQVSEWQRPIALAASAPFRDCFRLEEPLEPPGDQSEIAPTQQDGR